MVSNLAGVIQLALFFSWIPLAQSRSGAWLDMKVAGIAIVDGDTFQPLSYGRAVLRICATAVDFLSLGIGFFAPLWTRRNQTFADLLCNTVLVHTTGGVDLATGRVRGLGAPKRRRGLIVAICSAPLVFGLGAALLVPLFITGAGPGPVAFRIAGDIYTEGERLARVAGEPVGDSFFEDAADEIAPEAWESSINRVLFTTSDGVGIAYVCDSGPSTEICS